MINKRTLVLIVDDEKAICDLVCDELTGEGYVCDIASNADDALTKLKKHSFDVALLDIILPGMSGMDLLKAVDKCCKMTAIIMMTAVKDLDTAVEAMRLGASDYIVKPFTVDKLNTSIGRVLSNRERHCAVYHTIPSMGDVNDGRNTSRSAINAIAFGVDAKVDYFDFHSNIVTNKTIEFARLLDLPEKEIKKWAVARDELYFERDRRIKSMLSKLERNPMAQLMLGLTFNLLVSAYGTEQN